MITKKIIITGTVQGVFFRASAQQEAEALQLTGWVKNSGHDTVEALVNGSEESVDRFVNWCHHGPSGARVDEVSVSNAEPSGDEDFRIIR